MDGNPVSCYTVLEDTTKDKLICYIKKTPETYTICLTDATNVWSADISEDVLSLFGKNIALKSTEDCMRKIKSALATGSSGVLMQASGAALLRVSSIPADLSVPLPRLDPALAQAEVKELLFVMAAHLTQSGRQQAGVQSVSPGKTQHRRQGSEFGPRVQRKAGPAVPAAKRVAGDSLINPGSKKKCQPMGVAFDDAEED